MSKTRSSAGLCAVLFLLQPMISSRGVLAETASGSWEDYEHVSIIQLIATPLDFDGKKVMVCGFATMEFEGTALYLTRDDMKHSNDKNGLWLDVRDWEVKRKQFDRQFIKAFGVFKAGIKGHRGAFSGTIQEIARMYVGR